MKFSIVIPTYNRENDLEICLDSILGQTLKPAEIVVIDDGNSSQDFLRNVKIDLSKEGINFVYYKKDHTKERRGLSESKNISLELVSNEIFFILDDDLILDNNFFEKIMKVWQENRDEKLIGVGGLIKNNRKKSAFEKVYYKIFGLTSRYSWDVNGVGFQVWNEGITKREKGHYVHGGVSSYKKSLVKKLGGFATFSGGRTALEDVDFCLRAKNKGYYFIMEPRAKVIHNHSPSGRENNFLIGFKEGNNRKAIFKEHCDKNLKNYFWFWWANIGWVLKQFLTFQFSKGLGMIKGLFKK